MKSLRSRMLLLVGGAVLLFGIVQSAVVYFSALHEADELFDHHLEQLALSLKGGQFDAVTDNLRRRPESEGEPEEEFEFVIRVRSAAGERLHETGRGHPPLPASSPDGFSTFGPAGGQWRLYTIRSDGWVIEVAQSLALRSDLAQDFALSSVAPALVTAPAALLLVGWGVRRALAPLETLAHELQRRPAERLEPFDTADVLPELLPVVHSMNGLLGRIRAAFASQRAFVADAAHELRSPLTALKLQSQLLAGASTQEERKAAEVRLHAGVERSVRLAEQLLALAREEERSAVSEHGRTNDLVHALQLAAEDMATVAHHRSIDIEVKPGDEPINVRASLESMHLLARNLLENALRHAPGGSAVVLTVGRVEQEVELTVDDSGPGIPEPEHERVFDRFYRAPGAPPGGSGLGLSIVKAIAERCGGRVWLERSPQAGLRVCVRLPVSASGAQA